MDHKKVFSGNQEKEELSLRDFLLMIASWFLYIKQKWLIILLVTLVGGMLGFVYANFKKLVYTAECTFVLEDGGGSGGGLSQYAGLASMIGIDMGGSSNGIFQGDNIIELYRSKTMLRKTLLSSYSNNGKEEMLIDRYIRFNKIREQWSDRADLQNVSFYLKPGMVYSRLQDSLINGFIKKLSEKYLTVSKPDKKLSIIKVEVRSNDEVFAKSFNDKLVENVNDFYVQTRTKKNSENLEVIKHQTDSVRAVLMGAIFESASTLDATPNLNPTRQVLRSPVQRSQFNAEANKAILAELIKNQELAKLTFMKEMPLIKIVDQPIFPLDNNKTTIPIAIITGVFLSGFLVISFFSLKRFYKNILDAG